MRQILRSLNRQPWHLRRDHLEHGVIAITRQRWHEGDFSGSIWLRKLTQEWRTLKSVSSSSRDQGPLVVTCSWTRSRFSLSLCVYTRCFIPPLQQEVVSPIASSVRQLLRARLPTWRARCEAKRSARRFSGWKRRTDFRQINPSFSTPRVSRRCRLSQSRKCSFTWTMT